MKSLKEAADRREQLHENHATSRPLSDGYEGVGISGEVALSRFTGMAVDLSERPSGDKGIDGKIYLAFTVDVKAARKPYNLVVEEGKCNAEIYILAHYDDETGKAKLLGWEWGKTVKNAPVKDFGYGIMNHYIHRSKLKSMSELKDRMLKL